MTLGQRIQQIRIQHRLSQEEFGERLGTTRQTVSRWENDQTYPELAKIVQMSRIFSVTVDSIIKDGISTFDTDTENYVCGVYRSGNSEIADTEKFALAYYRSRDGKILGTKLYSGFEDRKYLTAVCERDMTEQVTKFAYSAENSVITNDDELSAELGEKFDGSVLNSMRCSERFTIDHSGAELPTVSEAGIPVCLKQWRMGDSLSASCDMFRFYLCTDRTEYIFQIKAQNSDIYCGASYNIVFDLGLFGGTQFFRIRNYKDNTEPFCGFRCDFGCEAVKVKIPTDECMLGTCVMTSQGYAWCVKRYNDSEIVLQGCGEDEYIYRRNDSRDERFSII